jgi:hypothetical protein
MILLTPKCQRRQDQTVEGLPGVHSIIDDILIYGEGDTEEEAIADHDVKFRALMERCKERNYDSPHTRNVGWFWHIKYGTDFLWIRFKTFARN